MAYLLSINHSPARQLPKTPAATGELRAGYGLVGDAHAGFSEREVSLLAWECIEQINQEHPIHAGPGAFAENLTVHGLAWEQLQVGDRLQVGPTLLEVVQIGKPPTEPHTYSYQGFSILPRAGIFCRVLVGGPVARGDAVTVVKPA